MASPPIRRWLEEPFVVGPRYEPYPEKPPRPEVPRLFKTEKDARATLEEYLSPYFKLVPEVRLLERGWPFQFIDYVAVCPQDWPFKVFGIEVKRGYNEVKDACDVIEQAWRYRKAVVSDDRVTCALNERLPFVFCWPELSWHRTPGISVLTPPDERARWQELAAAAVDGEARALRLIAGRSNVGSVEVAYRWFGESGRNGGWKPRVRLTVGQSAVWSSWGFEAADGYFGQGVQHGLRAHRGLRSVE